MAKLVNVFKSTGTGIEIIGVDNKDQSIEKLINLANSGLAKDRIINLGNESGMKTTDEVIIPSLIPASIGSQLMAIGFIVDKKHTETLASKLPVLITEILRRPDVVKRISKSMDLNGLFDWCGFSEDESISRFVESIGNNKKTTIEFGYGIDQDGASWVITRLACQTQLHEFFKADFKAFEDMMRMYRSKIEDAQLAFVPLDSSMASGLIRLCGDIEEAYSRLIDIYTDIVLMAISEITEEQIDEYRIEKNVTAGITYDSRKKQVTYYDGMSKVAEQTLISMDTAEDLCFVSSCCDLDFAPTEYNPEANDRFSNIEKIKFQK